MFPFAFDWRRPIEDEAKRLADRGGRRARPCATASGQPVRILAHSMGGLVARTMRSSRPQTWNRLMGPQGARLLMLGLPNGGSWAPMQMLTGDDGFGNALVAVRLAVPQRRSAPMMAGLPGLLQMQAGLLDPQLGLAGTPRMGGTREADMAALTRHNTLAPARRAAGRVRLVGAAAGGARPRRRPATQARRTQVADAARHRQVLIVVGRAAFTPGGL